MTYYVNSLQRPPPGASELFVTLNPPTPPDPAKTFRELTLAHPEFGFASWHAQAKMPDMQGTGGCLFYAGAWCGYGFHEDGMRAAVAALAALGLSPPWHAVATEPKSSLWEILVQRALCSYASAAITAGALRLMFPSGAEASFGEAEAGSSAEYQVVPSFPTAQPSPPHSSSTAAHVDIASSSASTPDVWTAPGPSGAPRSVLVRALTNGVFSNVIRDGSAGLLAAFGAREFEVDDVAGLANVLITNSAGLAQARGLSAWLGWLLKQLAPPSTLVHEHTVSLLHSADGVPLPNCDALALRGSLKGVLRNRGVAVSRRPRLQALPCSACFSMTACTPLPPCFLPAKFFSKILLLHLMTTSWQLPAFRAAAPSFRWMLLGGLSLRTPCTHVAARALFSPILPVPVVLAWSCAVTLCVVVTVLLVSPCSGGVQVAGISNEDTAA